LVRPPRELALTVGVTERAVAIESGMLPVGEVLLAGEQGAPDPIQRVVFVAASFQGVLLDAAADLVEGVAGQLHDMEGV
jgi:hypothetical protein